MRKVLLVLLMLISLTACGQKANAELETEIESLKHELKEANELAKNRLAMIRELEPHTKSFIVTEENTQKRNLEILDVVVPYELPSYAYGKSLIIMAENYPMMQPKKSPPELILENEINGRQLYDEFASEMKVGNRFKFTISCLDGLSESRDICKIIDIQPLDSETQN